MRASERQRRAEHKSGVVLTMQGNDGALCGVDAAELTPEQIREWVASVPRPALEGIVYDAVMAARERRPRL